MLTFVGRPPRTPSAVKSGEKAKAIIQGLPIADILKALTNERREELQRSVDMNSASASSDSAGANFASASSHSAGANSAGDPEAE